ncbi:MULTISPECIES: hypothetical protein [unclassified Microbacterium]|uniref:Gp37-like protein n=1 Tax=unclassified Microbacterium TaxID=2609290 RepID=UPI00364A2A8F
MRTSHLIGVLTDNAGGFVRQFLPSKSAVTLRAFAASTAFLTVPDSSPLMRDVIETDGARCQVWMTTLEGPHLTRRKLLEGRVKSPRGEAPFGTVTVPVVDDLALLDTLLGWQDPSAAITAQAVEYAVYTGPAETRVKAAVAANAARFGLPWDVVPTRGEGTDGRLELRMHKLSEKVLPILQAERLVPSLVRQPTGRWLFDIVRPDALARPLTAMSGVLGSWSWVLDPDEATDVVVGGRGEGTAREFLTVSDAARRTRVGYPLEVFVDAKQTEEGADITPSGLDKLAETGAKAGFTAVLREASWFTFPDAYQEGTRVPVQVGGLDVDDVISQIDITADPSSGLTVTPRIGLAVDDPQERLVGAVKRLAVAVGAAERR